MSPLVIAMTHWLLLVPLSVLAVTMEQIAPFLDDADAGWRGSGSTGNDKWSQEDSQKAYEDVIKVEIINKSEEKAKTETDLTQANKEKPCCWNIADLFSEQELLDIKGTEMTIKNVRCFPMKKLKFKMIIEDKLSQRSRKSTSLKKRPRKKLTPKLKNAVLKDTEEESVQEFKNEFKMSMEELVAGCPLLIAKEQKDDADAEWCGSGFTRKEDGDVDFPVDFASKVLDAGGFEFHSVCLPPDKVFKRMKRSEYLEHRMTALLEELITFRSGNAHTGD